MIDVILSIFGMLLGIMAGGATNMESLMVLGGVCGLLLPSIYTLSQINEKLSDKNSDKI